VNREIKIIQRSLSSPGTSYTTLNQDGHLLQLQPRMTSNDQSSAKPSLLVTVGSTLFLKLTDTILSAPILEVLAGPISTLKVQLGSAPPPSHLRTTLDDFDSSKGSYQGMMVEIMDYTTDFEGLVKSSDMVISHAGTNIQDGGPEWKLIPRIRLNPHNAKSWEAITSSTQHRSHGQSSRPTSY
jgi:UDP-N-acetylglucosamine:LPS N-acetylglucosamine transferase